MGEISPTRKRIVANRLVNRIPISEEELAIACAALVQASPSKILIAERDRRIIEFANHLKPRCTSILGVSRKMTYCLMSTSDEHTTEMEFVRRIRETRAHIPSEDHIYRILRQNMADSCQTEQRAAV